MKNYENIQEGIPMEFIQNFIEVNQLTVFDFIMYTASILSSLILLMSIVFIYGRYYQSNKEHDFVSTIARSTSYTTSEIMDFWKKYKKIIDSDKIKFDAFVKVCNAADVDLTRIKFLEESHCHPIQ